VTESEIIWWEDFEEEWFGEPTISKEQLRAALFVALRAVFADRRGRPVRGSDFMSVFGRDYFEVRKANPKLKKADDRLLDIMKTAPPWNQRYAKMSTDKMESTLRAVLEQMVWGRILVEMQGDSDVKKRLRKRQRNHQLAMSEE
jgi:hypothetical protein